jgi:hypothetical protein
MAQGIRAVVIGDAGGLRPILDGARELVGGDGPGRVLDCGTANPLAASPPGACPLQPGVQQGQRVWREHGS